LTAGRGWDITASTACDQGNGAAGGFATSRIRKGTLVHELLVVLKGLLLGIGIAAPVGPIGLLCIRRSLEYGPLMGFATGMGAAVADTFYGAIAAFGVSAAIAYLADNETIFQLVGGVVVLVVAVRTFRQKPPSPDRVAPDSPSALGGFVTALSLTLTNPATMMAFIAVFAGFGLGAGLGVIDAGFMVLGVFAGSSLWWLSLSMIVSSIRHMISERALVTLNHCSGVALALFGLWALTMGVMGVVGPALGFPIPAAPRSLM